MPQPIWSIRPVIIEDYRYRRVPTVFQYFWTSFIFSRPLRAPRESPKPNVGPTSALSEVRRPRGSVKCPR